MNEIAKWELIHRAEDARPRVTLTQVSDGYVVHTGTATYHTTLAYAMAAYDDAVLTVCGQMQVPR